MKQEEKHIIKQLKNLGEILYNKFGTDGYGERCKLHDIREQLEFLFLKRDHICNDHKRIESKKIVCGICKRVFQVLE